MAYPILRSVKHSGELNSSVIKGLTKGYARANTLGELNSSVTKRRRTKGYARANTLGELNSSVTRRRRTKGLNGALRA
eukprot:6165053-Pyramimonas_sp.AAC.1